MAHVRSLGNPLPVASALLQRLADNGVKFGAHGASIAKFCALNKQPFAPAISQNVAMRSPTLNQTLAQNLARLMKDGKWKNKPLAARAGVSPNTIKNYLLGDSDDPEMTASGKERSAKLAEVQRIANALGVHPLLLLLDERTAAALRVGLAALNEAGQQSGPSLGESRAPLVGLPPPKHKAA